MIGLGLAWLMISAGDPTNVALPIFYFPMRRLFLGIGLVLGLGLITGIVPAWQAMRIEIADALRRN